MMSTTQPPSYPYTLCNTFLKGITFQKYLPGSLHYQLCQLDHDGKCPGGGDSHMKGVGMLVVSLSGVNFGFFVSLRVF